MTILRLYLHPGWPDNGMPLPWSHLDAKGETIAHGEDAPARWPAAKQCELILPAGQTLFSTVKLPPGVRELNANLIGFALEEQLANDPAANLYALGPQATDQARSVAVTAAPPVRRAVAMLRSLGRLVDRILPEEALAPPPRDGHWQLAAAQHGWVLHKSDEALHFLPHGEVGEILLAGLASGAADGAPLLVLGDVAELTLPSHLQPQLLDDSWSWRSGLIPLPAFDFAQGELAANRHGRIWKPVLLRSAKVLGVAALVLLLGNLLDGGRWAWHKKQLQKELVQLSQPWLPNLAPGSQAGLAMLRKVDELRLAHGQAARLDPLPLLAVLAEAAGTLPSLRKLEAEPGQLRLETGPVMPEQLAAWQARLADKHYALASRPTAEGGLQLTLSAEP